MGDLSSDKTSRPIRITNELEDLIADVINSNGLRRLAVDSNVVFSPSDNFFEQDAKDPVGSNNIAADASVADIEFIINPDPLKDVDIRELVFSGMSLGIKFTQFLGDSALVNGIMIEIKANNIITQRIPIKTTRDFDRRFSTIGGFNVYLAPAADYFSAFQDLSTSPVILKKQGSFGAGNDDYIKAIISEDLATARTTEVILSATGRKKG